MRTLVEDVGRLALVLRSEEDLHRRMRDVLRREEAELVALDPSAIDEIVERKKALAEEGRLLEESRLAITAELAQATGLGEGPVKLSALVGTLGDEAGELPELHARLRALITSNQALLQANEGFAHRSLARVRETLQLLGRSAPEETGYGPVSRAASPPPRGRLVRQAI